MAKGSVTGADKALLKPGQLILTEGKAHVIADGADIPKMVGDAFTLRHDSPQPQGAGRHFEGRCAFEGLTRGPGMGYGGITGNPAGKASQGLWIPTDRKLFNALMHIAQALLQVQYHFADSLKPEVARFNDAGVHGSHGNLDDAATSRTGKWIFSIRSRLPALAWRIDKIGPQGELLLFPGLVPRPAAAVGCIDELNAEQEIGRASCREREQVSGRAVAPQQRRREHAV